MRALWATVAVSVVALTAVARAQQGKAISDAQYMTLALSAAPQAVGRGAAVVRLEKNGTWRTLRPGHNGFTCVVIGTDKMCNDANAMEFFRDLMDHKTPPDKVGFSYMLAGDLGASNTDPYAAHKTATNHWIVTGPHVMIVGPPSKALGYTRAKDPDPNLPYMMWAGTAYEHAMVPLGPPKK